MTDLDLAALRAKAEAATPGPWRVETDTTLVWGRCDPEDFTTYGMGIPLTEVHIGQQQLKGPSLSCDEAEATAQFIAAANPSVVLALLDRVEEAEAERTLACDELGHVYSKTDRLRSLLARAGEALRPFADDELHEGLGDGPDDMQTWWPGMRLGDYRTARTVAREIDEATR